MDWDSLTWTNIKGYLFSRLDWLHIRPERFFTLNAEMSIEELHEVLSKNIDTANTFNPFTPISRYKKNYSGDFSKSGFRIRRKLEGFQYVYRFCRIKGEVVSESPNPVMDIKIQSLWGAHSLVYGVFIMFFQLIYFLVIVLKSESYELRLHLLICFVSAWCLGLINYAENRKVHRLEKEFIKDVQDWFKEDE